MVLVHLRKKDLVSLFYHQLFDYPLTKEDLIRWEAGVKATKTVKLPKSLKVYKKDRFYFLNKKGKLIQKRQKKEKQSLKKTPYLNHGLRILNKIPTIKLVAVTGSLAMENAGLNSDIDLLIVTKNDTLWLTRFLSFFLLTISNINLRHAKNKHKKNKLCLNIWLDEKDLLIKKQNIYTSHEISQMIPVLNREKTYERFLKINNWILDWWPKAVKISSKKIYLKNYQKSNSGEFFLKALNYIAFYLQYLYMRSKITREIVTIRRAFFHPFDWSLYVKNHGF